MSGTAGDHMARQLEGIKKFNDGVAEQKKLQDKLFLENMAGRACIAGGWTAAGPGACAPRGLHRGAPPASPGLARGSP
jgi:hypothetical protein